VEDPPLATIIDVCPACGGQIDVTGELPFAQIYCPHCGEVMRARRMFNNFELVELIGEGGMGSVFKAHDHTLGRMVALKVLRRQMSGHEDERAKLEQEARITASVNHPHVVRVYSFGQADGQFYIAMELVEKGSLDDLMGIQTRVSEAQMLEIGAQVAQGLEAAAERGLIHRDVKPGNILFADSHTAKIVDFGLARVLEDEAGARGEIWGTPYYIAPERLNSEPEDFRSDIYSLGGTLFHAIAGRPPFEAENASLVALKQLKSQRVSLEAFAPDVAPETAYVINRMLERDPNQRYPGYAELIEHLEFARGKVLERAGMPPTAQQREVVKVESSKTKLYVALLTIFAALFFLGGVAWMFMTSDRADIRDLRGDFSTKPAEKTAESLLDAGFTALGAGDWERAAEAFAAAGNKAAPRSQIRQWAGVNHAASLALSGKTGEARKQWKEIEVAGMYSEEEADRALANLFLDAAGFGLRGSPIRISGLSRYPQEGVGSLVYFFAGVANHALGDKERSRAVLKKFLEIPAAPDVPYWQAYRSAAQKLLAP